MTLKQIKTHNIQVHRDVVFDLPEKGLVRFLGNNSNGKSVLTKALTAITANTITSPATRLSLITIGCTSGDVTLTRYDDVSLHYHIHVEASQTYAELLIPNKPPIKRYLADKQIPILRAKFGLHFDPVAERSINIFDSDDALLFFKTPHKSNYSMVTSALRDKKAEDAHNEFARVIKETKETKAVYEKQLAIAQAALDTLPIHDINAETIRAEKLSKRIDILETYKPLGKLPEIKAPKLYETLVIPTLKLPLLRKQEIIDLRMELPDVCADYARLESIRKGECPTCHRKFFS